MSLLWRKKYIRTLFESLLPFGLKKHLSTKVFKGKTAYIFAAGPSLNSLNIKKIQPELSENLVISIKQSVEITKDFTDIMLINFCNLTDFSWDEINYPVFWVTFEDEQLTDIYENKYKCNEVFRVYENFSNDEVGFSKSTAGAKSWGDLLDLKAGRVKWGPGLMYELAIPLALHLGVTKICLVAWDIGKLSHTGSAYVNQHFYDEKRIKNKMKINDKEIKIVSDSTGPLAEWLGARNIELTVISPSSLVSGEVKRENEWLTDE